MRSGPEQPKGQRLGHEQCTRHSEGKRPVGELILVRHGQTDANAAGLLQGRIDLSLNELGRAQADAIAASLITLARGGANVVASPLARARETAEPLGADVHIDARWLELDYGDLDGRPLREVPSSVWASWRADPSFVLTSFFPDGNKSTVIINLFL